MKSAAVIRERLDYESAAASRLHANRDERRRELVMFLILIVLLLATAIVAAVVAFGGTNSEAPMPERIQRKRTRGWRMPDNTVYVGRPSKWGNPFIVDERTTITNREIAVQSFRSALTESGDYSSIPPSKWPRKDGRLTHIPARWITVEDIRAELAGKNLACFCPLDQPCHADVLLELANGTVSQPGASR